MLRIRIYFKSIWNLFYQLVLCSICFSLLIGISFKAHEMIFFFHLKSATFFYFVHNGQCDVKVPLVSELTKYLIFHFTGRLLLDNHSNALALALTNFHKGHKSNSKKKYFPLIVHLLLQHINHVILHGRLLLQTILEITRPSYHCSMGRKTKNVNIRR